MRRPFVFADEPISRDSIQTLQSLTDRAKSGDITGVAYSITTKGKGFSAGVTGLLHDSPVFAIGTVVVLLYKLVMKAVGK